MTLWVLEARNTENWSDCRYREYTRSLKKAMRFKEIPKLQFTDSGHGIVCYAREHTGAREPNIYLLSDYVKEHMKEK